MARGRPHGRSKSDHRVCQAAQHARAAEYRERIAISAEQQEARIAAVNAECTVEDAPRRRRGQKPKDPKTKSGAARVSVRGRSSKASGSAKKKAKKRLEHALGKAAGRDPHTLCCHECGATAEFGLRGSKWGGEVLYLCRGHVLPGCFRIDTDRADWVEDREMCRLRAEERRLEKELRELGGASFAAEPAAEQPSASPCASAPWKEFQSTRDWVAMPMKRSLIAMLLTIGGVESNPGPLSNEEEIEACRRSWEEANPRIGAMLLAYLAKEKVHFADWGGKSLERRLAAIDKYKKAYEDENVGAKWSYGWDDFLENAGAAGRRGKDAEAGQSKDVEMQDADQENQNPARRPVPTSIHDLPELGNRKEGINKRRHDNCYTPRQETIEKLTKLLFKEHAVLIRSAPATGKTSTLQLLATYLKTQFGADVRIFHLSLQEYNPDHPDAFDKVWERQNPDVDFESVLSPRPSPTKTPAPRQPVTVIIVDEAQKAFIHPHLHLFGKVKSIQGQLTSNLKILMVSSWGSNIVDVQEATSLSYATPGTWDATNTVTCWYNATVGLGLQLTVQEAEEYWGSWVEGNGWSHYMSTESEMEYLMDLTERQPGALSLLLDKIEDQGWGYLEEDTWHKRMKQYLLSEQPVRAMQDLRSMQRIVGSLNVTESAGLAKDLLRELLQRGGEGVDKSKLAPPTLELARKYTRWGQLVFEANKYHLPSQLHFLYLTRELYAGRSTTAVIREQGLFEFIVAVVERFNRAELVYSDSRRAEGEPVYERLYQNLFYYEARRFTPLEVCISPDVGRLYGSNGYLDFLLGTPLLWAVEIMREGKDPDGHLDRFIQGGRYSNLLERAKVKDWAVIDFRTTWSEGHVPVARPGMIEVFFTPGYEHAHVVCGSRCKTVEVRGPL
ncbi:hypothetical protein KFL_005970030 [Klebsormidium nitens]|uniref:Uncharacterized protein n=1 Tax=Klebsormidium nitens TaxID=105231 RepID=A0A1Y1IIZ9_KLENI|nr:hypothetical protein KFL_005970030 [Klebsormidium nitens]|eukprot:GAQ90082.1 hypothetical protein KFL_005970030 [Klebsormidium nitens]